MSYSEFFFRGFEKRSGLPSQDAMSLGGGRPRSLELESLDNLKPSPYKAGDDAIHAVDTRKNTVDAGAGLLDSIICP